MFPGVGRAVPTSTETTGRHAAASPPTEGPRGAGGAGDERVERRPDERRLERRLLGELLPGEVVGFVLRPLRVTLCPPELRARQRVAADVVEPVSVVLVPRDVGVVQR